MESCLYRRHINYELDILMTCIVAIADGDKVYMGGDRGHSTASWISSSTRSKISQHGEYLFGYSSNAGIGQWIQQGMEFPPIEIDDPYKHLITVFMPALRDFLANNDIKRDGEVHEADLYLGFRGKVYEINTDHMYCTEYEEIAGGSGYQYAFGSLHTSIDKHPIDRITLALDAAITYCPSCRGPVDILFI